ncbi:MAG: hypothetical protein J6V25_01535 [Oscillospiraceae bacterium]|nr:hypothetical protein [Oscillospiraceae bacterium]
MKKFFALLLVLLSLTGTAFADTIDLSGMTYNELVALKDQINLAIWNTIDLSDMTYNELVALKDQINLAIWNSQEWQEVTVPQGVWKVGEDIPAGHWTVICAPEWRCTCLFWGQVLADSGQSIVYEGRYSISPKIYNPNHKQYKIGDGVTEYSFEARNGEYIDVQYGSCIFMPYAGKPSLGFK